MGFDMPCLPAADFSKEHKDMGKDNEAESVQLCVTCGESFDPRVDGALSDGSGRCLCCTENDIGLAEI